MIGRNVHGGRYLEGRAVTAPVSPSRKGLHSSGALPEDGFSCRFHGRASGESLCDFPGQMHMRFGKAVIIPDNASMHKSGKAKDRLKELGGDIVPYHTPPPPYTPELNPVGVQWRTVRKAAASVLYGTAGSMRGSIRRMLGRKETGVAKMSRYLT